MMTNSPNKKRFIELDILRILALFLIFYVHSTDYIDKSFVVEWFRDGATYIGLGIFVFLSGYGLQYSITGKEFEILPFLKKRILKIYPLYLFSLFIYIFLFHFLKIYHVWWNFSPINQTIFLHLFSLQVIFSPIYPQIYTLWFIGLIIPLYFIFAIIAKNNNSKFIKYNIGIFLFLIIIRILFHIIDLRFFLYYPIFIIGILYARKQILNKLVSFFIIKKNIGKLSLYSAVLSFICIALYFCYKKFWNIPIPIKNFNIDVHLISYIVIFSYTILAINCLITITFLLSHIFNRKVQSFANFISYLSAISYPAYLLHRVIYAIAYFLILNVLNISSKIGTILFPLVTILLFMVATFISRWEKLIVNWVFKKLEVEKKVIS